MKKNLFDPVILQEVLIRLDKIQPDTEALWGKMNAAQMFAHCAEVLETYAGRKKLKIPWYAHLMKGMIYKVVFGDQPYNKNAPTLPQFKKLQNVDFESKKQRLLDSIDHFYKMDELELSSVVHPLFKNISRGDRGWAMYKHLDHHLNQFGV